MGTELLYAWTAEVGLARVRDNSRDLLPLSGRILRGTAKSPPSTSILKTLIKGIFVYTQEGVVVAVSEEWFSPHCPSY